MDNIVRLDVKMKENEAFIVYGILDESYKELLRALEGKSSIEEIDNYEPETIKEAAKGLERIINELELVLEV